MLEEHYQKLGKERDFEAFDSDWKIYMYNQLLKNTNNNLSILVMSI